MSLQVHIWSVVTGASETVLVAANAFVQPKIVSKDKDKDKCANGGGKYKCDSVATSPRISKVPDSELHPALEKYY